MFLRSLRVPGCLVRRRKASDRRCVQPHARHQRRFCQGKDWFKPFPPQKKLRFLEEIVSPGRTKLSTWYTLSMFKEPKFKIFMCVYLVYQNSGFIIIHLRKNDYGESEKSRLYEMMFQD